MRDIKKTDLVFNTFRLLRICALAVLLLGAALALSVVSGFYDGLKPVQLESILIWSALILFLFMLWMYAKHRDPRILMTVGERYTAAQFLYEPHFCSDCGTRRILVYSGQADSPVAPNTLLGKRRTVYYCPHCRDAVPAGDCIPAKSPATRFLPRTYRTVAGVAHETPCRPLHRYVRLHGTLLLVSLCLCVGAAALVQLHVLFLLAWWAALYLLFLFSYHTLDNLLLAYWITDVGLLQRSLTGFHLLRWEEINQVTEVATQGNAGKMVMVFAQSGNWVLSPVLEGYDRLTDRLKAMCKKRRIPYCENIFD